MTTMTTMNFSSIDTNTLNTMYNDARQKRETLKENRKAFKQDMMNQIEAFMQGMFGKHIKVTMLDPSSIYPGRITFSFDNSCNSSLAIDFGENEETGKFEAKINNQFTYVDFDLTSDTNTSTTKIEVIYCIVKNIDRVKDILLDKLEYTYNTLKKFRDENEELCTKIFRLSKEFEYREKTAKDDEIWSKILDDKKLQKKFIVIKNTNKSYLRYNGNFVHFVSEPDMKKNLKTTPWKSEQIVKVSNMRMMIH